MQLPALSNAAIDLSVSNYEQKSFQYQCFADISLKGRERSFFRCDFRGAKFERARFSDVSFPRSDLNNSTYTDVNFNHCDFSQAGLNKSYFKDVVFENCKFHSAGIDGCIFEDCVFNNISFSQCGIRNSKFHKCTFNKVTSEKSTNYNVNFHQCCFGSIDFSNMYSYDFFFAECLFEQLIICPDYIGSYFFSSWPTAAIFNYRDVLEDNQADCTDILNALLKNYSDNGRIYEAVNLSFHLEQSSSYQLNKVDVFTSAIKLLLKGENPIWFKENLEGFLKLIKFYLASKRLHLHQCWPIVKHMPQLMEQARKSDAVGAASELHKLIQEYWENAIIDLSQLREDAPNINQTVNAIFRYEHNDESRAIESTKSLFFNALVHANISVQTVPFTIVAAKKGSVDVFLTALLPAMFAVGYFLRRTSDDYLTIRLKTELANRAEELIAKADDAKEIMELAEVVDKIDKIRSLQPSSPPKEEMPSSVTLEL